MFDCIDVDAAALRGAASAAREASETIVKAGELADFGETVERALKGSRTARYAAGLETLWHEELIRWSRDVADYEEKMSGTAETYERVDEERADALRREGNGK
ncbi:type VII secretion target [Lentzea sp. BCCO 10_0798]|uniref:Type VII secretion target n=1 Tax=Lentzea kristufekii TaxID=3095430 RepID=A0ABU4U199_9PSEU|nr:type VII secretion target [Lentzea sp. BCCO 10_0798]MDX8054349.1 type VII secretion target [Lentzea sp. BCCO 10_0798]